MSRRKTLRELATESEGEPMQIAGKPADVCPYCGAAMFAAGTRQGESTTFRYVHCRNKSCGKRFMSKQPKPAPATIVREIGGDDENASLRVYSDAG